MTEKVLQNIPQKIKAVIFKEYVEEGLPIEEKSFVVEELPFDSTSLNDGEILLKLLYISVDPYMRGKMKKDHYTSHFTLNKPGCGDAVAQVIASKARDFSTYDLVIGTLPWQEYAKLNPTEKRDTVTPFQKVAKVLAESTDESLPLSSALGTLGMPGVTAYFGFQEICQPKKGEKVVVSGAAGAVGSVVVQIAKIKGCSVLGIAGGKEKVEYLKSLGCDHAFNYKEQRSIENEIKNFWGDNSVDCYFDNVGGEITDEIIRNMNRNGRIACCGAISQYNKNLSKPVMGLRLDEQFVFKQLKREGFIVSRWADRWNEAVDQLSEWATSGKIQIRQTEREGIDNVIKSFNEMFHGKNIGKMVVKIADRIK